MTLCYATVMCCLLAMSAHAAADVLWGINGHPVTAYPGVPVEQQLDYVADLGLRSYRVNVVSEENSAMLAELIDAGKARGIDILPVLTPQAVDLDEDSPEELYDKARKLAYGLGVRFRDDIRVWELGNEMENHAIIQPCESRDDGTKYPCEWGPAGGTGPLDYYGPRWVRVSAVLKGLSDGIRQADPGIKKAIGTAGWGHTGAFARMKQDGIEWDISVWHIYGEDPEWAFREISAYGKPIWVTEFNNPYGSQRNEEIQADGLKHAMARLRELSDQYKVEAAHIYELLDETYWAPDFEAYMGLVRLIADPKNSGQWPDQWPDKWIVAGPKPAYQAVRDFIRGKRSVLTPERNCDLATTGADYARQANQTPQARQAHLASFAHCLVLGGQGDPHSIDEWAAALQSGDVAFADMIMAMLRSAEFASRYSTIGLSDSDYVDFLFRLLLNRPADDWGLETYSRMLRDGSMTRDAVANGIVLSDEFSSRYPAGCLLSPCLAEQGR